MKYFNKQSFCFLVFFSATLSLVAEKKFSFNFSAGPSLIAGSGFEYVFWKNGTAQSRLEWPLLPAGGLNINADIKLRNGIHASFFSSFIIPSYSGTMKDYDYINKNKPKIPTRFSAHDSYIKKGMDLSFNLGWMKPLIAGEEYQSKKFKVKIEPSFGIRYIVNSWDAVDGYIQYPDDILSPVLPDTPIVNIKGLGISYTQSLWFASLGLLFNFELPKKWNLNLLTQISPEVIGTGEDFHYMRELKFVDVFEKRSVSFYVYFSAEKKFSNEFSFFSSIDYTSITAYNGKTFEYNIKSGVLTNFYPMGSAGTALYAARLNLGFKLHFGK